MTTPNAPVSDAELERMNEEAIDPTISRDYVTFGDGQDAKRLQVRIPKLKAGRKLAKILAPKLEKLTGLAKQAQGAAGAAGLIAIGDMGPIIDELADDLHEMLAAAFDGQGVTADWIDEHAGLDQVADAIQKLLGKVGLTSLLGKPSPTESPSP